MYSNLEYPSKSPMAYGMEYGMKYGMDMGRIWNGYGHGHDDHDSVFARPVKFIPALGFDSPWLSGLVAAVTTARCTCICCVFSNNVSA